MVESRTNFQNFLEKEIESNRGISYPIRASLFELMFKKRVRIGKLHPNPDDEFCFKEIGPNYNIISNYEKEFRKCLKIGINPLQNNRLTVEKIHPDGYMILNGHHRWAAARNVDLKKATVDIVNPTHADDIRKMLEASDKSKRVTFDLDEVIFDSLDGSFEKPPRLFKGKYEKIRLGIPALFHYFYTSGYDIWVFSANYYSIEYIRHLFKRYGVNVDGIVTGTKRTTHKTNEKKQIEKLISQKYTETISIDNEAIVITYSGKKDFDHIPLESSDLNWSAKVLEAISQ